MDVKWPWLGLRACRPPESTGVFFHFYLSSSDKNNGSDDILVLCEWVTADQLVGYLEQLSGSDIGL